MLAAFTSLIKFSKIVFAEWIFVRSLKFYYKNNFCPSLHAFKINWIALFYFKLNSRKWKIRYLYSREILLNTATIREVNSTEIDSNFTARETQVISNPDLTLFDAEMWDLGKFETKPFFIGYCKKGCRDVKRDWLFLGVLFVHRENSGKHCASSSMEALIAKVPAVWWEDKKKNLNLSGEVFFLVNVMIGALSSEFCSSFQELRKQKW